MLTGWIGFMLYLSILSPLVAHKAHDLRQPSSLLLPWFVSVFFLVCPPFLFLSGGPNMSGPFSRSHFQDDANVLTFCCLVESGVGGGLRLIHL